MTAVHDRFGSHCAVVWNTGDDAKPAFAVDRPHGPGRRRGARAAGSRGRASRGTRCPRRRGPSAATRLRSTGRRHRGATVERAGRGRWWGCRSGGGRSWEGCLLLAIALEPHPLIFCWGRRFSSGGGHGSIQASIRPVKVASMKFISVPPRRK